MKALDLLLLCALFSVKILAMPAVSSVPVPEAESLLHADCNGQEITCEISRYYPQEVEEKDENGPVTEEPAAESDNEPAWFISSLQVSGGGVSVTLVMKTQPITKSENENLSRKQKKLDLLLGTMGTLLLSVEFAVYTRMPSIHTSIGQSVQLDCGFTEGNSTAEKISVEWRLQHKGIGRRIYTYKDGEGIADRPGTQMELQNVILKRNASLFLSNFEIKDEGTYICIVYATRYHAQQVMQALIMEPPHVQLIPSVLYLQPHAPMRATCDIGHYYPLDVEVMWLKQLPGDEEKPTPVSGTSFSSHRQNRDGTYSVSSYIWIQPLSHSEEPIPTYMCQVAHITLQEPSTVTLVIQMSEESIPLGMLGLLAAACLIMVGVGVLMCRAPKTKSKVQ
ncbi:tapasin-related protein isoform X2 [Protopterus annectens]|uniref:tapasin-related protein isoform X2 n=1 Tax=Protopterus annectens TaxID=7888 RepID=UPI001CFB83A7|nr:tapasin-related protein isoform X2 [Protopterus annectens]